MSKLRDKIVIMGCSKELEAAIEKRLDAELGKRLPGNRPTIFKHPELDSEIQPVPRRGRRPRGKKP